MQEAYKVRAALEEVGGHAAARVLKGNTAALRRELELVESHHPIVDALEKGRGGEAGLLLRNHVETILEFLKKSESDSEFYRALLNDLEGHL